MRPQDIETIANAVMQRFSRPTPASAGCAGISDPQPFDCAEPYACNAYTCGGGGPFACDTGGFTCVDFSCPALTAGFSCVGGYAT